MIESALAGARLCEHIAEADGAVVFRAACNMGRRCQDWVKLKNIAHPATERAMLIALSKRRQRG